MMESNSYFDKLQQKSTLLLSELFDVDFADLSKSLEPSKNPEKCDFTIYLKKMGNENSQKIKDKLLEDKFKNDLKLGNDSKIGENVDFLFEFQKEVVFVKLNRSKNLKEAMLSILEKNNKIGYREVAEEKVVLIEYSSPNIAKEFHAGHLRTTLLGSFLEKIYRKRGYNTISINYLGDYGKQFGMVLEGFKRFPELVGDDIIKSAFNVYVKISGMAEGDEEIHERAKENFRKLEQKDEKTLKDWENLRNESIKKYKKLYEKLNVNFDIYSGESFFFEKCIKILENPQILEKEGAKYCDLSEEKLGSYVLSRSNGTTLYSTRDVAAALERLETPNLEKLIYVVACQQDYYFMQLFHCLKKIGNVDLRKLEHVSYGMVSGMSTRRGTVVFLEDILSAAQETMGEVMRKDAEKFAKIKYPEITAQEMAISALIVQDFSARRMKGYTFVMEDFMAIEGETGPYLQYTHCRLFSILEKNCEILNLEKPQFLQKEILCKEKFMQSTKIQGEKTGKKEFAPVIDPSVFENFKNIDAAILKGENSVNDLIFHLIRYENVLDEALEVREPMKVVSYLMKISKYVNKLFSTLRVFNAEHEIAKTRLAVFECARYVLSDGMRILGMKPLERV